MHNGDCDVAILSELHIRTASNGNFNEIDCAKIDAGMTEEKAADTNTGAVCKRDGKGGPDPTRDCSQFVKVGGAILSVPVSMPMNSEFENSFSYSFRSLQAEGKYSQIMQVRVLKNKAMCRM